MTSDVPPLVGIGAIFIDDIVLPDGQTHMEQLGGGVVHAVMGAAIWDACPGIAAVTGADLPESALTYLGNRLDTRGLHKIDLPQIRAWQIFEHDGTRRELYRVRDTEPFIAGAQPHYLPQVYRKSPAFYLLQDFAGVRKWRAAVDGIVLWEPLQQIMISENLAQMREVLQTCEIDIVSPNLAEAQAIYGDLSPHDLIENLLNDGARIAVLRMGPEGSMVASRENNQEYSIPPVAVKNVIDQTGAGNTYCGAFLLGIVRGKSLSEAAAMGAVAASFCIEQIGALDPEKVSTGQRDQRFKQIVAP
jgi:hypothetical protein